MLESAERERERHTVGGKGEVLGGKLEAESKSSLCVHYQIVLEDQGELFMSVDSLA